MLSLDWDRQGRVTPAQQRRPRPRKPGLKLRRRRRKSLWREPRWNADSRAPPRKGRGRARKQRHTMRLSAFRLEFYFFRSFPFVPFVIAGLDPAIHAENNACAVLPPALPGCNSAWTTGSSPVVTSQRAWRVIARALGRAARTRFYFRHHCARREIVNSYNPTPSDRACA